MTYHTTIFADAKMIAKIKSTGEIVRVLDLHLASGAYYCESVRISLRTPEELDFDIDEDAEERVKQLINEDI